MSNQMPGGSGQPLPPVDVSSLTKPPSLKPAWEPAQKPAVVSNGTYARVKTKSCYADRREEDLDNMRQYYAKNKDMLSDEQATRMQQQMSSIQNSIDPSEQSLTSGPTANQIAGAQARADAQSDFDEMYEPLWFVGPAARKLFGRKAGNAVSVQLKSFAGLAGKGTALKEKIGYKDAFTLPKY